MFYGGRAKQMPYFSDYVASRVEARRASTLRGHRWVGLRFGVPMIAGGALLMALRMPQVAILLVLLGILGLYAYPELAKMRDQREAALRRDALEHLHQLLLDRKLHRALEPALMEVLESGARAYRDAKQRLESPLWNAQSGGHWSSLSGHLSQAMDTAMEDLCLIAAASVRPVPTTNALQDLVDDVAQAIHPAPTEWTPEMERARQLAEKLVRVAAEVERSTQDVKPSLAGRMDSDIALDAALGELKTLREAEKELNQDV